MKTDTGAEVVVAEPTMEEVAAIGQEVTPEVTPEPAAVVATPEDSPPSEPITEETPAPDAVEKRIGKITAEKYGFKREADGLRAELEQLKAQQGKTPLPEGAPKEEDFDFDPEKYNQAMIQYEVRKQLENTASVNNVAAQEEAKRKISDNYNTEEAKYIEEHPKYVDAVGSLPKFPQDTLNIIYEMGPQVTHYLADNPDKAYEIAGANLTQAAVKLGQISMGLTADTKTVKPSGAPEPVVTLSGGAGINKSQEDMDMDEIMALP